jgi:hypothetical protein
VSASVKVQGLNTAVTRNVTFLLTDCDVGTLTRVVPVSFDSFGNGTTTLTNLNGNQEWIAVREGHTLRRRLPLSFVSCSASADLSGTQLLLTGDLQTGTVAQDNLCDIVDFSILASRFNDPIDATLSTGADVTGNGIQDMADFTALQVNFFKLGETTDGCPGAAASESLFGAMLDAIRVAIPVPLPPLEPAPKLRHSVAVDDLAKELDFPEAEWADINRDGVIDTMDMLEFAIVHEVDVLPEFVEVLRKLDRAPREGRAMRLGEK